MAIADKKNVPRPRIIVVDDVLQTLQQWPHFTASSAGSAYWPSQDPTVKLPQRTLQFSAGQTIQALRDP